MPYRKLKKLSESSSIPTSEVARSLCEIIECNPNRTLLDERDSILEPLGIDANISLSDIRFYSGSGRVSVRSHLATTSVDDTIRVILLAPPNHPEKMMSAIETISKRQDRVTRIQSEIIEDGLCVHAFWEKHLDEIMVQ